MRGLVMIGLRQHATGRMLLRNSSERPTCVQKRKRLQLMDGDTVDLSNTHIAGVADGQWEQHGTTQVGGVTHNVYEHSSANVELLIEQAIRIDMH